MNNTTHNKDRYNVFRKGYSGSWKEATYKIQNGRLRQVSNDTVTSDYGIINGYSNIPNSSRTLLPSYRQYRVNVIFEDSTIKSLSFKTQEDKENFIDKLNTTIKESNTTVSYTSFGNTSSDDEKYTCNKFIFDAFYKHPHSFLKGTGRNNWTYNYKYTIDLSNKTIRNMTGISNYEELTFFSHPIRRYKQKNRMDVVYSDRHKISLSLESDRAYKELKTLYNRCIPIPTTKTTINGGSKKRTKSKKTSKRMRKIYVGPRGGKYIKKNGRKIHLNNLK